MSETPTRSTCCEGRALLAEARTTRPGAYAVQAAIAALHDEATDLAATDWPQIVALYDVLLRLTPSPVIQLNRAVAVAMRDGPAPDSRCSTNSPKSSSSAATTRYPLPEPIFSPG